MREGGYIRKKHITMLTETVAVSVGDMVPPMLLTALGAYEGTVTRRAHPTLRHYGGDDPGVRIERANNQRKYSASVSGFGVRWEIAQPEKVSM